MPSYMVTTTLPEGADDALAVDAKSATVVTVMLGLPGPLGSMALENKDDYLSHIEAPQQFVPTPLIHSSATAALASVTDNSDVTSLLEDVIDELPVVQQTGWTFSVDVPTVPAVNRSRRAGKIFVPPGRYTASHQIDLPVDKAAAFDGWQKLATCISATSGFSDSHLFHVQADGGHTERPVEFLNMTLQGAGISFDGNCRRGLKIADMNFLNTNSWAVEFLGASVVYGEISRVFISESQGGIYCPFWQCDGWVIKEIYCVRNNDRDLTWASSGLHLEHADFELRAADHLDKPHIHLPTDSVNSATAGGDMWLTKVRFGNEGSSSSKSPRDLIVIGPLDDGVTPAETGACHAITLDVYGRGSSIAPALDPTSGVSVLRLRQPAAGVRLSGTVWDYKYVVDDTDIAGSSLTTLGSKNNVIDMIYANNPPPGGLFASGVGHGWRNASAAPACKRPGEGAVA